MTDQAGALGGETLEGWPAAMAAGLLKTLKEACEAEHARAESLQQQIEVLTRAGQDMQAASAQQIAELSASRAKLQEALRKCHEFLAHVDFNRSVAFWQGHRDELCDEVAALLARPEGNHD